VTHAKKLVEVITGDYALFRGLMLYSAHKIKVNYHIAIEVLEGKKQKLKNLLAFSKIPPFVLMSCAIFFVVGLLTKILF
jgi:hypothetical protein